MTKKELDLLEKAFLAEIDGALTNGINILQTKSKIAEKLVNDGLLNKVKKTLKGCPHVTIEGYVLTDLGNLTYCTSERCLS